MFAMSTISLMACPGGSVKLCFVPVPSADALPVATLPFLNHVMKLPRA